MYFNVYESYLNEVLLYFWLQKAFKVIACIQCLRTLRYVVTRGIPRHGEKKLILSTYP